MCSSRYLVRFSQEDEDIPERMDQLKVVAEFGPKIAGQLRGLEAMGLTKETIGDYYADGKYGFVALIEALDEEFPGLVSH